ncbi:MAG: DUF134 domain-containing protein [Bacteroidota bacterium]
MPRPKNNRLVYEPPVFTSFKPVGVKGAALESVILSLDEFEAFRLADDLGLSHEEAAEEMEISRPTFTRLIEKARKKIAEFIIGGKVLSIDGGNIHFRNNIIKCQSCGHMFRTRFDENITECPSCHSDRLLNLAGGFGHGKCCTNRNQKRGGNYASR